MNDAYAVKVLTAMRVTRTGWAQTYAGQLYGRLNFLPRQYRREIAALSCAIRALTGKRPTRRKK